jgi:hypothetical protein
MGPATISDRGLPPQSAGPLVHAQLTVGVVDRVRAAVARGIWPSRDPRSVSDSTMGLR